MTRETRRRISIAIQARDEEYATKNLLWVRCRSILDGALSDFLTRFAELGVLLLDITAIMRIVGGDGIFRSHDDLE